MDLTQATVVAPSLIDKVVGPSSLFLKSKAPFILTGLGIVGVVTAGVLAARATLHLEPITTKHKLASDRNRKAHALDTEEYTRADYAKAVIGNFSETTFSLCKLYGPSITLGGLSIAAIVTGHNMQYKRFLTAATSLKASEVAFTEYREQVAKVLGDDAENDLYRGIREEIVENEETNNEEVRKYITDRPVSEYARVYGPNLPAFSEIPMQNDFVVNGVEDYFNGRLQRLGYVFLSEVYEKLGFEVTQASRLVGWKKNGKDKVVKFNAQRFHTDEETVLLLDFNVDGVIITDFPEV